MYRYVEVPRTFSLRQSYLGHQTGLSTLEVGYLARSNHVILCHHGNERRASGERYENHPLAVAEVIRLVGGDVLAQCKAKLHDILERLLEIGDEDLYEKTVKEITSAYPVEVIQAVLALTKFNRETYEEQLFQGNFDDPWIIIIKLADRLHNIRTICGFSLAKQQSYLFETSGSFLDLCERSEEAIRPRHSLLIPVYEGMIRQLREEASYKLGRVNRKIATAT